MEREGIDGGNAVGLLISCFYGLFQEVKAKNSTVNGNNCKYLVLKRFI